MQSTVTAAATAEPQPAAAPAAVFDRTAFRALCANPDQLAALDLTGAFDSFEHEASWLAHSILIYLRNNHPDVWRYGPGVDDVTITETHNHENEPDGGAVVTVIVDGIELTAGHLEESQLLPVKQDDEGRIRMPKWRAAGVGLISIANAVNAAVVDFRAVTGSTPVLQPLRAIRRILLDAPHLTDPGLRGVIRELLVDAGVWTDADDAAQEPPTDRKRGRVLAEVMAEMNRTDENLDDPSEADYYADVARRFTLLASEPAQQ